ncbi:unnamed protein product [Schistocephalus solidus]|uniref:DUF1534 domain-containing protein n=1 Tax=Schistocephalus solidus TaxID=70667 RepID=A0A183TN15_SCHSO|nr:unnamed protein product [Schistocephalus solidus]
MRCNHPRTTTEVARAHPLSPFSRAQFYCSRSGAIAHLEASQRRSTQDLARHGSAKHGGGTWTFGIWRPSLENRLG